MNGARNSLLSLFDPLNTPTRDVSSPDSDKENSVPTMSAFFNRTYRVKHVSPVVLTKRLVDVGDVTVDNSVLSTEEVDQYEEEESLLDESLDEDITIHAPQEVAQQQTDDHLTRTPSSPRTPLGDIALEAAPVARKKLYRREEVTGASKSPTTLAPPRSPLAFVINSINFPDRRDDSELSISTEADAVDTNSVKDPIPSITVSSSVPTSLLSSTANLIPSPRAALLTNTRLSLSASPPDTTHLRPRPTTSSLDPRRTSADLHTSFNLQLQCPETSFDLLNDKISFLGGDSFLGGLDEEEFDIKKEEAMMEILAKKAREWEDQDDKVEDGDNVESPKTTPEFKAAPTSTETTPHAKNRLTTSPLSSTFTRLSITKPKTKASSPPSVRGLSKLSKREEFSPVVDPSQPQARPIRPPETPRGVPAPAPGPGPVPALRIIKRAGAGNGHERTGSSTSTSSTTSTSTSTSSSVAMPPRRSSIAPPPIAVSAKPSVNTNATAKAGITITGTTRQKQRPTFTGVQRPPPGLMPPPVGIPSKATTVISMGKKQTGTGIGRIVGGKGMSDRNEEKNGLGGDGASRLQRPPSAIGGRAAATSRIVPGQSKIGMGGVSGLRQPSRYTPAVTTNDIVGTERPKSRLPAPGSRIRMNGVGEGGGMAKLRRV